MKKFLTLIVALILMLTSAALAENVPAPHFGTQTETEQTETAETAAAEDTKASAVEYSVPSGQRVFPYAPIEAGTHSGFTIRDWEFTDAVQAEEPAEYSLKYTALPGTKLLHIRFVTRYNGYDNFGTGGLEIDRVEGIVVDGTQKAYFTTIFIEGNENEISKDACLHETLECNSHSNNYMLQIAGTTKSFKEPRNKYALCDIIAEIPEELVGTDMPLYLIIKLPKDTETEYYIQIQ